MDLDPLLLSRIQFAFVVSFHILFPAFTIGLAAFIAVLEGGWLFTRRRRYLDLSVFWTKIFAISFGMGVVSGIVMSYQFGTNWSRFADITANILGPLLSYEVQTAFFLEATFLGILLFGRGRVPDALVFVAALMVALGTFLSSFWILSASSWMHTPDGYTIIDGVFQVTDWWAAVFNPSFPYRLAHMVVAAFITTGLVVVGVSAWHLGRDYAPAKARLALSMTLWLLTVLVPAQIVIGDLHGLNTFEHQPLKVAAMEGHWETRAGAPLILFAWPDMAAEENRFEIAVPKLGSLILTHDSDGVVRGLKDWPPEDRPYVPLVFWSFRVMLGAGVAMLGLIAWSLVLRARGTLFTARAFRGACIAVAPLGFVAVLAGWFTTEAGRQPWVVYNLMRTAEGVTPALTGWSVVVSLAAFALAYAIIFGAGLYFILRTVARGPEEASADVDAASQESPHRAAEPAAGAGDGH